jgi:hypothetical protein
MAGAGKQVEECHLGLSVGKGPGPVPEKYRAYASTRLDTRSAERALDHRAARRDASQVQRRARSTAHTQPNRAAFRK